MDVQLTPPPAGGVWRVGRDPDPLAASKSSASSELSKPGTGNRFDSPSGNYGVRYFGTTLDGCFMAVGDIPADWRQRRTAVRVGFPESGANEKFRHGIRFLDIESFDTREALRPELAELLAYHHYTDLDVAVVRGRDRRITRYISQWAFEQTDEDDRPLYAGVRYLSRLNSDWECWAVFDDVEVQELQRRPIRGDDPAYNRIARGYGLTPH